MSDQAEELRYYVLTHGRADAPKKLVDFMQDVYKEHLKQPFYDDRHNITVEIAPVAMETFEDYQQRLAWYRTSQELSVKSVHERRFESMKDEANAEALFYDLAYGFDEEVKP